EDLLPLVAAGGDLPAVVALVLSLAHGLLDDLVRALLRLRHGPSPGSVAREDVDHLMRHPGIARRVFTPLGVPDRGHRGENDQAIVRLDDPADERPGHPPPPERVLDVDVVEPFALAVLARPARGDPL